MKPPQQQRGNVEGVLLSRKLFSSLLIVLIVSLGLVCLYHGTSFAPGLRHRDHHPADGYDPVFQSFIAATSDKDEDPPSLSRDAADLVVKSFPVLSSSLIISKI